MKLNRLHRHILVCALFIPALLMACQPAGKPSTPMPSSAKNTPSVLPTQTVAGIVTEPGVEVSPAVVLTPQEQEFDPPAFYFPHPGSSAGVALAPSSLRYPLGAGAF